MKRTIIHTSAAAAVMTFGLASTNAAITLFSFEATEPDTTFVGNPTYAFTPTIVTSGPGITNGTQALQVVASDNPFGGVATTTQFLDPTAATLLNNSATMSLDLYIPALPAGSTPFSYGNIDFQFTQGTGASAVTQETEFTGDITGNVGSEATLTLPLYLQGHKANTVHLALDPTMPFSYQIDFSYAPSPDTTDTFIVDNVTVPGAVPEPASLGLLGLAGGFFMKRRSR